MKFYTQVRVVITCTSQTARPDHLSSIRNSITKFIFIDLDSWVVRVAFDVMKLLGESAIRAGGSEGGCGTLAIFIITATINILHIGDAATATVVA